MRRALVGSDVDMANTLQPQALDRLLERDIVIGTSLDGDQCAMLLDLTLLILVIRTVQASGVKPEEESPGGLSGILVDMARVLNVCFDGEEVFGIGELVDVGGCEEGGKEDARLF